MEHFKGILATVATGVSAATAWANVVELALRIGVSAIGIVAGLYAIRYWHRQTQKAMINTAHAQASLCVDCRKGMAVAVCPIAVGERPGDCPRGNG